MSLTTKLGIGAILILACLCTYLIKRNQTLAQKTADQSVTIKSLELGVVSYKNKFGDVYTRSMNQVRTANELVQSKDSTISALMTKVMMADIKLKNVVQIGSTVTKLVYDTNLVYVNKDTTYNASRPPHIYQYVTVRTGKLSISTDIRDTVTTISHLKKEFVEPRKNFFLARWFQARQNVICTDKTHSNPFITTSEQTDITVVDKQGKPIANRK